MDTKLCVLQDWIKKEHITIKALLTQYNLGDQFTKALGQIKFYEQADVIMKRRIPKIPHYTQEKTHTPIQNNNSL